MKLALRRTAPLFAILFSGILAINAQNNESVPSMARSADPAFEVAVIKPSDPADRNQGFHLNGRRIFVENNTMTTILCFAYSIQKTQIVNAPSWFDDQPWDIQGVPDTPGAPSWPQYRQMLQKLLSTRFGLVMHHDKRDLSVYSITIAKGGPKLEKSKSNPDALSGQGTGQYMKFTNVSMIDFAQFLQLSGDRPVVNQTDLPGRYDFTLLWTPDTVRNPPTDTAPDLFTAVQEQLGLKLAGHARSDGCTGDRRCDAADGELNQSPVREASE